VVDTEGRKAVFPTLTFEARTAADLMTTDLASVRESASLRETIALMVDRGVSAVAVTDAAGRPVGVLSRADVLTHDREKVDYLPVGAAAPKLPHDYPGRFQIENVDRTTVSEVMTPVVFTIEADAPAFQAVENMLSLKVHRLFVVDRENVVVGVISTMDVLRCLKMKRATRDA
jgi:predicted transcriptional regulator